MFTNLRDFLGRLRREGDLVEVAAEVDPRLEAWSPQLVARAQSLSVAAWWLSIVGVCTLASGVIFGLREEVRDIRRLGQYAVERKIGGMPAPRIRGWGSPA